MKKTMRGVKHIAALLLCIGAAPMTASADTLFGQFLTGSSGGVYDVLGGAMTNVINQNVEGVRLNPSNPPSVTKTPPTIDAGNAVLGIIDADTIHLAMNGLDPYEKPLENIAVVMALYQNVMTQVVLEGSPVQSLQDVRGKRVGVPSAGTQRLVAQMYELAGVPEAEIEWFFLNYTAISAGLKDGTIDVGTFTGYPKNGAVEELASTSGIRLLSPSADLEGKWNENNSRTQIATIPGGTYPGVAEDARFYALFVDLITNKDTDSEAIAKIMGAIYDNRDAIAASHPAGKGISPEATVTDVQNGVISADMLHPGAVEYFKSIGVDVMNLN